MGSVRSTAALRNRAYFALVDHLYFLVEFAGGWQSHPEGMTRCWRLRSWMAQGRNEPVSLFGNAEQHSPETTGNRLDERG